MLPCTITATATPKSPLAALAVSCASWGATQPPSLSNALQDLGYSMIPLKGSVPQASPCNTLCILECCVTQTHTPCTALDILGCCITPPHKPYTALDILGCSKILTPPQQCLQCQSPLHLGVQTNPSKHSLQCPEQPETQHNPPADALHNSGCNPQPGGWLWQPSPPFPALLPAGLCPLPSTPLPCAPRRSPGSPAMCTAVSLRVKPAASRIQWLERMAPLHIWFNARAWRLA